jgi:quercetin dioxygenase-like cupin family protein
MPIIRYKDVEVGQAAVAGTQRRLFITGENAGAITLGEVTMSPGTELPLHTHKIEEAMVITKGKATCIDGDDTYELEPGDVILAPAGSKHLLGNRTSEPMTFIFFYPAIEVKLDRV